MSRRPSLCNVLHTEYPGSRSSLTYPPSIRARIPENCIHTLTAYGVDGVVLLAPAGWAASHALIYEDGGCTAALGPTSSKGPFRTPSL